MSAARKIAYRNLWQHRTKTLIVGVIIAVGIAVLVVGNSTMATATRGIERTFIQSYTGHLVIHGAYSGQLNLFGIVDSDGFDSSLPTIPEFDAVYAFARAHPQVAQVNPQATASAVIDFEDARSTILAFGIDAGQYGEMFPDNYEILAGRELVAGEDGILLAARTADELARIAGRPVQPGDAVLLTASNQITGLRVREVPVRGIFRFAHSNSQLDTVSLVDIANVRAMTGMNIAFVPMADLSERETALFEALDEADLFGGDALFADGLIEEAEAAEAFDEEILFQIFGTEQDWAQTTVDSSTWHFLLIRLHDGADMVSVYRDFERFFDEQGIDATIAGWLQGAGPMASMAYGLQTLFNLIVMVVAVVAVIVIMNTLVISVTERTAEIGTMRALGAQRRFVRRMIAWETLMTSGIFGLIGVAVGCLLLWLLHAIGIEAANEFVEVLFGGKVLHPVPSIGSIVASLILVVAIGLVASLYPASVALKTQPVRAMQGS